ncbi:MAG: hypothetical protein R3183_11110 [Oleiphilaceae bacterium]|nr:hypothetical protein [Oleiphilaceae bacterium]
MFIRTLLAVLLLSASLCNAEVYNLLSFQVSDGLNNLRRSTSALINIGLGAEWNNGLFAEWSAGMNAEVVGEAILDRDFLDQHQQALQMELVAGYALKVGQSGYLQAGIGLESALFHENCAYSYTERKTLCQNKLEHGPTYKLGYFFRETRHFHWGFELSRDELSDSRRYNGISFVVRSTH